jgi:hypothetical protein
MRLESITVSAKTLRAALNGLGVPVQGDDRRPAFQQGRAITPAAEREIDDAAALLRPE